jgi:hypothetical protein
MSIESDWLERAEAGDGQFAVAHALLEVANALHKLGVADAATPMGAIESLGAHLGEKLNHLADATSSGLGEVADALVGCVRV